KLALAAVASDQWEQFCLVANGVDLVGQQKRASVDAFYHFKHKLIAVSDRFRCVDNQKYQVYCRKRIGDDGHHSAIELVTGFVYAGCIEKDYLTFGASQHASYACASCLRLVRDYRDLFADQRIEQS